MCRGSDDMVVVVVEEVDELETRLGDADVPKKLCAQRPGSWIARPECFLERGSGGRSDADNGHRNRMDREASRRETANQHRGSAPHPDSPDRPDSNDSHLEIGVHRQLDEPVEIVWTSEHVEQDGGPEAGNGSARTGITTGGVGRASAAEKPDELVSISTSQLRNELNSQGDGQAAVSAGGRKLHPRLCRFHPRQHQRSKYRAALGNSSRPSIPQETTRNDPHDECGGGQHAGHGGNDEGGGCAHPKDAEMSP